jgi:hypothetical protein
MLCRGSAWAGRTRPRSSSFLQSRGSDVDRRGRSEDGGLFHAADHADGDQRGEGNSGEGRPVAAQQTDGITDLRGFRRRRAAGRIGRELVVADVRLHRLLLGVGRALGVR